MGKIIVFRSLLNIGLGCFEIIIYKDNFGKLEKGVL